MPSRKFYKLLEQLGPEWTAPGLVAGVDEAKEVLAYREALAAQIPAPGAVAAPAAPSLLGKADYTNSIGMKFIPVKGTAVMFCLHETRYQDYAAYAATVKGVDETWKDQSAGGFIPKDNLPQHPVWSVSWTDAQNFCAWLSRKEGRTYRLPTDQEWSYAVGLGRSEKWTSETTPANIFKDETEYFWGERWPPPKGVGNYNDESRKAKIPGVGQVCLEGYDDGYPSTSPVMSFKPNKLGLYDMDGNVREWVADWYDNTRLERALRGASWGMAERTGFLSSGRFHYTPDHRYYRRGFRCVLEVPGAK